MSLVALWPAIFQITLAADPEKSFHAKETNLIYITDTVKFPILCPDLENKTYQSLV